MQAVEVWVPQGEVLALAAGHYRHHHDLAQQSAELRLQYGQGLPGAVWAKGQALLWRELPGLFVRAGMAAEAGIDGVLGWPLFDGKRLVAVVTLLLGRRTDVPGSVELWDVADELDVLKHGGGHYVHAAELARFSPFIQFPRGTGLPGLTWVSGRVHVMDDLQQSNAFIRAGLCAQCGLKRGIGWPIFRDHKVIQVLTLFGAETRPFVSSAELYRPHGTELGAATVFDWSGRGSARGESSADAPGRGLAMEALASSVPALSGSGSELSLALPLYDRKGLRDVLVVRM